MRYLDRRDRFILAVWLAAFGRSRRRPVNIRRPSSIASCRASHSIRIRCSRRSSPPSTFPEQIPDASRWADEHHYLTGEPLARAIADDHLPMDPSVQALLPFPSVLHMMAADMPWTTSLGNAFLDQPQDVTDAAQRLRHAGADYRLPAHERAGDGQQRARTSRSCPPRPGYVVVPYYDPLDRLRAAASRAIGRSSRSATATACRSACTSGRGAGAANRIVWTSHAVIINDARWARVRANRLTYVHPYAVPRYAVPRPPEPHRAVAAVSARATKRSGTASEPTKSTSAKSTQGGGAQEARGSQAALGITLRSRLRDTETAQRFLNHRVAGVTEIGAHAADPNASHAASSAAARLERPAGTQATVAYARACVPAVFRDVPRRPA